MSSHVNIAGAWIARDTFYEDSVACRPRANARFYQTLVRRYYSYLVLPDATVLEMGCGLGDLLAEVKPSHGIGVDFSAKTVAMARERHPELEFQVGDAAKWRLEKGGNREIEKVKTNGYGCVETEVLHVSRFSDIAISAFPDYILLADLINDLRDVQGVFDHLRSLSKSHTRLVLNFHNNLWRPVLAIAEWLGAKAPSLTQNWLSTADVKNLLHLAGWEVIKEEHRILWPLHTSFLSTLLNRWLAPFLRDFCLSVFLVARPRPGWLPGSHESRRTEKSNRELLVGETPGTGLDLADYDKPTLSAGVSRFSDLAASYSTRVPGCPATHFSCSVIIPARNEAGNIESVVLRTPELGLGTELIFVEGDSTDDTWEEVQRIARKYPHRRIKLLKQLSKGKGSAVREGFEAAKGDLLFILDADLTMPPEELPKFYEVARSGTAEFVNGVRLVYPMEHEAMRFLNMIANKIFGVAFSWLLGQQLKDTLCGTKVLFRCDYKRLAQNRAYFGEFDPFGDFDLLFGAAKLNLRMIDLPIRYRARTYGETNIRRWRHGWLLFRMVFFGARRLKFL